MAANNCPNCKWHTPDDRCTRITLKKNGEQNQDEYYFITLVGFSNGHKDTCLSLFYS